MAMKRVLPHIRQFKLFLFTRALFTRRFLVDSRGRNSGRNSSGIQGSIHNSVLMACALPADENAFKKLQRQGN